jgi:phosphatidylethanolamine/phosphatidyl-N-methylethanolamine N-methyltransferase
MGSASWQFFQEFIKSPREVASLVPSSPLLERRVVRACELTNASAAVELGSGTGGTTRALLRAMPRHGRLVAIELNAAFAQALGAIDDDRLVVEQTCASAIGDALWRAGLVAADVVVSGIPFSTLPRPLAERIVAEVHDHLRPGGRFVAYQVSDRVAAYARPVFGKARVEFELCNVPPMRVFSWRKA